MTQQEIEERNKDIALMLGWKEHKLERNRPWDKKEMTYYFGYNKVTYFTPRVYVRFFKYHSDWNWLMKVVEFIESLHNESCYMIEMKGNTCVIRTNTQYSLAHDVPNKDYFNEAENKISALFYSVSDFAKDYNNKELWKRKK